MPNKIVHIYYFMHISKYYSSIFLYYCQIFFQKETIHSYSQSIHFIHQYLLFNFTNILYCIIIYNHELKLFLLVIYGNINIIYTHADIRILN